MEDRGIEALTAVLDPLLETLEALGAVARYFHPPLFPAVLAGVGAPDNDLRAALPRLEELPENFSGVRTAMEAAAQSALAAFTALREAGEGEEVRRVYRAFRHLPAALEALYPLAGILPPVNRFFLEPESRADEAIQRRLMRSEVTEDTGVMHFGDDERGGFALYVPEDYTADRDWPLVMALHGGSGDGPRFLWSWLVAARAHGAVLVAPTSLGPTWALEGEDVDSPNLARILDFVREQWRIDPARLLLTGMSDGGTFSYLSGLDAESPFTHLAPVSAAFHPMFAAMADEGRLRGLPIHIVHGALDWMFPVYMARGAARALEQAGAAVTYREIDDLSHTYPRELNKPMLQWMAAS